MHFQGFSLPQTGQSLSNEELDGISAIVNDDDRWTWSQSVGGRERVVGGGEGQDLGRDEVIRQRINSDGRVAEEGGEGTPEQVDPCDPLARNVLRNLPFSMSTTSTGSHGCVASTDSCSAIQSSPLIKR